MQNQAQIHKIKEDQIALLRAFTGDENLQIEFDEERKNDFISLDQNLISQSKKVILPFVESEISANRAALDLALCYFLFHDSEIHSWKKFTEEEQKFFDEFEKVRVIANVENVYFGSLKNILCKL